MRIATALHQEPGDAVVAVVERNHDRADAFRRRQIHIRLRGNQRFDAAVATAASGVQQRRESAIRVILRAWLRGDLARPVGEPGARIHSGALRDQDLHHVGCVAGCRSSPHQRRLILNLLDDVDLGAGIDEHLEHWQFAILDGDHQRRLAVGVGAFRSGACVEQRLHNAGVALPHGFRQWRVAELVRHIDPGFLRDQRVNQLVVDAVHRPVNRPCPVGLSLIHVGARLDHGQGGGASSFLDRGRQLAGLCHLAGRCLQPVWPRSATAAAMRRGRSNHQDCGNENETVHTTSGSSLLWFPHRPRAAAYRNL